MLGGTDGRLPLAFPTWLAGAAGSVGDVRVPPLRRRLQPALPRGVRRYRLRHGLPKLGHHLRSDPIGDGPFLCVSKRAVSRPQSDARQF